MNLIRTIGGNGIAPGFERRLTPSLFVAAITALFYATTEALAQAVSNLPQPDGKTHQYEEIGSEKTFKIFNPFGRRMFGRDIQQDRIRTSEKKPDIVCLQSLDHEDEILSEGYNNPRATILDNCISLNDLAGVKKIFNLRKDAFPPYAIEQSFQKAVDKMTDSASSRIDGIAAQEQIQQGMTKQEIYNQNAQLIVEEFISRGYLSIMSPKTVAMSYSKILRMRLNVKPENIALRDKLDFLTLPFVRHFAKDFDAFSPFLFSNSFRMDSYLELQNPLFLATVNGLTKHVDEILNQNDGCTPPLVFNQCLARLLPVLPLHPDTAQIPISDRIKLLEIYLASKMTEKLNQHTLDVLTDFLYDSGVEYARAGHLAQKAAADAAEHHSDQLESANDIFVNTLEAEAVLEHAGDPQNYELLPSLNLLSPATFKNCLFYVLLHYSSRDSKNSIEKHRAVLSQFISSKNMEKMDRGTLEKISHILSSKPGYEDLLRLLQNKIHQPQNPTSEAATATANSQRVKFIKSRIEFIESTIWLGIMITISIVAATAIKKTWEIARTRANLPAPSPQRYRIGEAAPAA